MRYRPDLLSAVEPFGRGASRQRREADQFFEELTGQTAYRPHEHQEFEFTPNAEAVEKWDKREVPGTGAFQHAPLDAGLRHKRGYNVEARWNVNNTTAYKGAKVDIVVYLHGYGAPSSNFLACKAFWAGLEMPDAIVGVKKGRGRPILALVPLGIHSGTRTWKFPNLKTEAAFNMLVNKGLHWLEGAVLKRNMCSLRRGRVTLVAHSGGGSAMNNLLSAGLDPDMLVCYDSTYGGRAAGRPIIHWTEKKIADKKKAATGALRVFYRRGFKPTSPDKAAREIKKAVDRALRKQKTHCATLAGRYRVERTDEGHSYIPKVYTSLLLDDITAIHPCPLPDRRIDVCKPAAGRRTR